MAEYKLDVAGAVDWLDAQIKENIASFLDNAELLPSWDADIDRRLKSYLDGLAHWVRGYDCWSFESQRYFGKEGLEIQKRRWIKIHPRKEKKGPVDGGLYRDQKLWSTTLYVLWHHGDALFDRG